MNFWDSHLGPVTGLQEDAFIKSYLTIPDGTTALAQIKSFQNKQFHGNKYLQIDWELIDGEFKGKHVFQKIHVFDADSNRRHKALNMLMLLYKLYNLSPSHSAPPQDLDLRIFTDKIAGIRIQETKPNQDGKQYNWVSEIHSPSGFVSITGLHIRSSKTGIAQSSIDPLIPFKDDDIPF